jgi:rhodanese-related sulfurtransferase
MPGDVNLPHSRLTEQNLAEYPSDTLIVVYCAGPHCNGADKAAVRLARLGRPVEKMRCFQIMECDEPSLLTQWMAHWEDLTEFTVIPVVTSAEAAALVASRL